MIVPIAREDTSACRVEGYRWSLLADLFGHLQLAGGLDSEVAIDGLDGQVFGRCVQA